MFITQTLINRLQQAYDRSKNNPNQEFHVFIDCGHVVVIPDNNLERAKRWHYFEVAVFKNGVGRLVNKKI